MGAKSERQKAVAKLDALWGKIVRERDGHTCRSCNRPGDNPHHIFSRRHLGTRWDPENGLTLCWACHNHKAHGDPLIFGEWVREKIGEQKYQKLRMRAIAVTKVDLVLVSVMLNQEWNAVRERNGEPPVKLRVGAGDGSLFCRA